MTSFRAQRVVGILAVVAIVFALLGVATGQGDAWAKRAKPAKDGTSAAPDQSGGDAKKKDATPAARGSAPRGVTLNACGCYREGSSCVCTNKNARCDCPEDCEPIGCEEKRQKEMDREIAAEVKHAQDEEKKREEAEAARERKATQAESAEDEGANEAGEKSSDDAADGMPDPLEKTPDKATGKAGAEKAGYKPGGKSTKPPPRKDRAPAKK
jgi:hypothetical protein